MSYVTGTRAVQAAGQALHAGSRQRVPRCRRFGIRFAGIIALHPALHFANRDQRAQRGDRRFFVRDRSRALHRCRCLHLPPARREGEKGSTRHA